jgi:hypothetical protein
MLLEAKVKPGDPFFEIISDAYHAFAGPKPKSIEVCENCCMYPDIEADFFNPPIRELPLEYVRDWYFAAYQPPGVAKETWSYLLPRILEILATGEQVSSIGFEVSLSRFQTGDRANWSTRQWTVLDRFQRAFLDREIRRMNECLDDFVCMFALAGWPLDDLLAQIEAASDEELALRFWNDWVRDHAPGREGIWITAFWESSGNSEVYDFYTSQALHDRMTAVALDDATDPELAAKAFAVASVIEASTSSN